MVKKDPRVDAYIAGAASFAKPVLRHLRKTVHAACPQAEETIKWGAPTFTYHGMLCGMAAFKQHVTFGFWKHALLAKDLPKAGEAAWGNFGRILSVADLPSEAVMRRLVKQAMALNEQGVKVPRKAPPRDRKLPVPAYFMSAVRRNKKALETFQGLSYSHRKEYIEWVSEAKTDATRTRRLETAVAWMADGKGRNWKYERK